MRRTRVQDDVDAFVDVRHLCVERLTKDPSRLVRLFKTCGKRELDLVVSVGGWGGSAGFTSDGRLGGVPLLVDAGRGGALVGLVTDWVALQLLFRPVEPTKVLGTTWHGF